MKRTLIALTLVIIMLTSIISGCTVNKEIKSDTKTASNGNDSTTTPDALDGKLEHINYASEIPIVKEGHKVSLRFCLLTNPALYASVENCWFFKFIEKFLNIDPKIEAVPVEAHSERLNLMFASKDVPDIVLGFGINTREIVKYGVNEGQLLSLNDYINPTYMPNVYKLSKEDPGLMASATAPDGNVYKIPRILDDEGTVEMVNIRQSWLDKLNLESPSTLDEFIETMRIFKKEDVDGHGSENVYPLGGSLNYLNPLATIINAMGYNFPYSWASAAKGNGLTIAIRDGKATFPCNDDIFYDFLSIAKTLYDEELISPDFFTMDQTKVNAMAVEGVYGYMCQPMHVLLTEPKKYQEWFYIKPLTSKWNDTPQVPQTSKYDMQGIAISANTKYPEVCARFIDLYYGDNCFFMWNGAMDGTEETLGFKGWIWDESANSEYYPDEPSAYNYISNILMPYSLQFGLHSWRGEKMAKYAGKEYKKGLDISTLDLNQGGNWNTYGRVKMFYPYAKPAYPPIVYRSEEDLEMLAEYSAVIGPYVTEQVALFITGTRSLNEFEQYLKELKSLGMDEYEQYYIDEYQSYLEKQK